MFARRILLVGWLMFALSCDVMSFDDEDEHSFCKLVIDVNYRPIHGPAVHAADDPAEDAADDPAENASERVIAADNGSIHERKGPHSEPTSKVFGGTVHPTIVPLAEMQLPAIGSLDICSGTLIAPTWVLTAQHCRLTTETSFCIGKLHDDANICIKAKRVINHPVADLTLIELTEPPAERMPGLHPIPILTEPLDCSWLGTMAEAAGYGRAPNLGFGNRFFTAEPIVGLTHNTVTIDGLGRRGLCRGDSGGPVMIEAPDGSVRVAGVLQGGDASCRGLDFFGRTDTSREWIESFTGAIGTGSEQLDRH